MQTWTRQTEVRLRFWHVFGGRCPLTLLGGEKNHNWKKKNEPPPVWSKKMIKSIKMVLCLPVSLIKWNGLWGNVLCLWGNYHKYRLSQRDCLPLMWPASLWGLLWQLVDGVTENKWGVFSRRWYGEEGANWVHRKKGLSLNNGRIVHLCQRPGRYTVRYAHIAHR